MVVVSQASRVRRQDASEEDLLSADLVVDATGRGSRMPVRLEGHGYPRPTEDESTIRLTYSSQLFRMSKQEPHEVVVNVGFVPGRPEAMGLFSYENDLWM
jgi:hypothetical protein